MKQQLDVLPPYLEAAASQRMAVDEAELIISKPDSCNRVKHGRGLKSEEHRRHPECVPVSRLAPTTEPAPPTVGTCRLLTRLRS